MAPFRAYDIRGIYPSDVNEELAEKIGKAFGTFILEKQEKARVAVGGDVRTSTPPLKEKFIEGLLSTGVNVIDTGMVPSPVIYFAVASLGLDGGAVVTASHCPKDTNGFKLVGKNAAGICDGSGLEKIKVQIV